MVSVPKNQDIEKTVPIEDQDHHQDQAVMELKCEYQGCDVKKESETMDQCIKLIEIHERTIHMKKEEVKQEKKPERKGERPKVKPPRFLEKETREEFNRKHYEFPSYSDRTILQGEEVADDLYLSCETPLKRKLRASHLVDKDSVKKTSLKVLFTMMERICLPKVNVIVERKQFK